MVKSEQRRGGRKRRKRAKQNQRWRSPRRPLRVLPEDAALAAEAMVAMRAYQDAASATERGRRALALCDRGNHLGEHNGDHEGAHDCFREAAMLFSSDEKCAAAAWVWHSLAESYTSIASGVRRENLYEAERLFRRALDSPARQQEPERYPMSQDGLSRCLRDLAQFAPEDKAEAMLDEALDLLVDACERTIRVGSVGWSWAVAHLHNLGTLYAVRDERDLAIEVWEEACRHWKALERHPGPWLRLTATEFAERKGNSLCSLASARLARFRPDDRKRVKACLDQVIAEGHAQQTSTARLLLARYYLRSGGKFRERVADELAGVVIGHLDDSHHHVLLDTLIEAGLTPMPVS